MDNYWDNYPALDAELSRVRQFMLDSISDAQEFVKKPMHEVINSGGKMLRPALVILGAKFGRYSRKRVLPIAACVELLHTATLIHDDIIDESKLRRGIASVQSKYSKEVAILVGDYIFAKTFELLSGDYPPEMLKNLSHSIMRICEGELSQYTHRYSDSLDMEKYIEIIGGKTAALFSMSLFVGAYEAGAQKSLQQELIRIGYFIGMMFQIIDDCLDYHGASEVLGKNTVNDIKQGYITLPMLLSLQNDKSGKLKNLVFKSSLSKDDIVEIKKLVIDNNGVKMAEEKAKEYSREALKFIKKLPRRKSRTVLEGLVQSLIKRTY